MFDLSFMLSTVPAIFRAMGTTVWVAIVCSIGAATLGFAFELLRRSGRLRGVAMRFVIDFIRSTPILVQLYFFYFVLPHYGVTMPSLVVGVFALSLYYSGYLAEVFKAGIDSIPRGQFEAAQSLGLSGWDTTFRVVLPQMLRAVAAPMGNYFVSLLKATPYLAVISVHEMLGAALDIGSQTFRYPEPMIAVGIIFLALALAIAQAVHWLELRLLASDKR
ncbi:MULTISPECIES: ectoine/hydroxyectoine ABC transporter permease subunit EhuD [unclassified Variovorax]|uniref:ectoine/hydroxyectoine ABC transporter permease subunit EhuD n=1 Tax=unclassified Variovorax TaxID=663243 RepID=UPI003F45EA8A